MRALLALFLVGCAAAPADEPPVLPVGLDAYRMWERWPVQRIGARAYMRSTYDRKGGNESADASHFLYQQADDFNVSLDVEGRGVLYFARYNHWHGSPWHYEVDGTDHLVQESSTKDPTKPVENSVFLPEALFPPPLASTWSLTKGADLSWVPIGFEKSFRMAYSRTRYGTGYYIFHRYVDGAPLSQPIRAWDAATPPERDVLDLISRAGTDIAPPGDERRTQERELTLSGPATLRALQISVPREQALAFGKARLRVTWDGASAPSIDAPVALFFGAGVLYNRDQREYLVKAFPMNVRYTAEQVQLACYFPMPFRRSAKIEIVGAEGIAATLTTRCVPGTLPGAAPFHASYADHPQPVKGQDLVLLDTQGAEGAAQWSGSFVGMSWIFSHAANLGTLEGDPRFFFDDAQTPQAQGTGTEEWGGGGDYWGGRNMTLPFAGHPTGAKSVKDAVSEDDKIESAYRFLLADLMPFGKRAVIRLEHGGTNQSTEHYEAVTYWYGVPSPALVKTDELAIGDPASEAAHRYVSPGASAPEELVSRYEWGPDTLGGQEIYPAHAERVRRTRGVSEFELALDPANQGVMLRRTLDYGPPNQRAEVFVAPPGSDDWTPAGIWSTPGSNTCVYSDAKGELGATLHNVQTSNRRFRDDEFLLPKSLTQGRRALRLRLKFAPLDRPLFPGHPFPIESSWAEIKYEAWCWRVPRS